MTKPHEAKLSVRLEAAADTPYDLRDLHGRADLLREAAQLVRRMEEAPSGEVWQHMVAAGQRTSSVILTREPEDGLAIIGQRVRLVREQES